MMMSPDFETEAKVVTILMNRPENVYSLKINLDDFEAPDYRRAVEAIKNAPEANDYLTWYSAAKDSDFTGEYSDFQKLGDGFVTDTNLKKLLTTLHQKRLSDLFNNALTACKTNPSLQNSRKAMDILRQRQQVGTEEQSNKVKTSLDDIDRSIDEPRPSGVKFNDYPLFNRFYGDGVRKGLHVIAARTSIGKSAFALNLAMKALENNEHMEVDVFTLEMDTTEYLLRALSYLTGIKPTTLRNPYDKIDSPKIKEFLHQEIQALKQVDLRIYDNASQLDDIESIMTTNASMKDDNQYLAIVDYLGLIEVPSKSLQRYQQLAIVTRDLKNISENYNIPIFALAQLNRQLENRDDKKAKVSDIAGSGSIEQDANSIIILQKNADDDTVRDCHFAKNRDGEIGTYQLKFIAPKMRMLELDK